MDNNVKTVILISAMTGLLVFGGLLIGGETGAILAFVIAAGLNFLTYWYSDKIVLGIYGPKPIEEKEAENLHKMVEKVAAKAGIPKPKIYLVPQNQPNAFATGRNPEHGAICFTYGILQILDKDELEGVIAHEMSHIKNRDILITTIVATIAVAITLIGRFAYYLGFLIPVKDDNNIFGSILSFILLVIVTPIIAVLLQLAISRSREYLADSTAAKITHKPTDLANALKKLHAVSQQIPIVTDNSNRATAHMFIVNPFKSGLITNIMSTHPPIEKRVEKLQQMSGGI